MIYVYLLILISTLGFSSLNFPFVYFWNALRNVCVSTSLVIAFLLCSFSEISGAMEKAMELSSGRTSELKLRC